MACGCHNIRRKKSLYSGILAALVVFFLYRNVSTPLIYINDALVDVAVPPMLMTTLRNSSWYTTLNNYTDSIVSVGRPIETPFRPLNRIRDRRQDKSFAACLMTSDDNLILSEWLAYHYTVLPLRYVVILDDPRSKTSALEVLKRWDNTDNNGTYTNNLNLTYVMWNDADIMTRTEIEEVSKIGNDHKRLIRRQKSFVRACNLFLQKQNQTWVTHIDTDEFIVTNRVTSYDTDFFDGTTYTPEHNATSIKNTTWAEMIQLRNDSIPHNPLYDITAFDLIAAARKKIPIDGCLVMPRLVHGTLETVTCPNVGRLQNISFGTTNTTIISQLETLRFVQTGVRWDFATNKWGKAMLDVSRIKEATLEKNVPNVHRPVKPECAKPILPNIEALFVVHHYLGSWERYSSRIDDRRSKTSWIDRGNLSMDNTCGMQLNAWFHRFVHQVGVNRAAFLIRGNER